MRVPTWSPIVLQMTGFIVDPLTPSLQWCEYPPGPLCPSDDWVHSRPADPISTVMRVPTWSPFVLQMTGFIVDPLTPSRQWWEYHLVPLCPSDDWVHSTSADPISMVMRAPTWFPFVLQMTGFIVDPLTLSLWWWEYPPGPPLSFRWLGS